MVSCEWQAESSLNKEDMLVILFCERPPKGSLKSMIQTFFRSRLLVRESLQSLGKPSKVRVGVTSRKVRGPRLELQLSLCTVLVSVKQTLKFHLTLQYVHFSSLNFTQSDMQN